MSELNRPASELNIVGVQSLLEIFNLNQKKVEEAEKASNIALQEYLEKCEAEGKNPTKMEVMYIFLAKAKEILTGEPLTQSELLMAWLAPVEPESDEVLNMLGKALGIK